MIIKNKRFTKAIAEAAAQRREEMFAGMTNREIELQIPINKGYLYEYENNGFKGWGLIVDECVLCGQQHKHGNGGKGNYSIHCDHAGEVYPFSYDIKLVPDDEDNIRLSEKYGVK